MEIIKELRAGNLDYVFLIFHPSRVPEAGALKETVSDCRDVFLRKILNKNNISYIWSKDIIIQNIKDTNRSLSELFLPNDGHPTPYFNRLIAKEIKNNVFNSGGKKFLSQP